MAAVIERSAIPRNSALSLAGLPGDILIIIYYAKLKEVL